jgi:hypothetical protein
MGSREAAHSPKCSLYLGWPANYVLSDRHLSLGHSDCMLKCPGTGGRVPYLIELFIIGHSQQDVPGRDPSLLVVSCCVASQFQYLR